MVKPCDSREPVNITPISFWYKVWFRNHFCGVPELLNDYKQLLDEVFVISRIIKVKVWLRLKTLTKTLIILDITKTEFNNCFIIHLVFTSNNLISPRPSELTPDQLLIDISSHLISSFFLVSFILVAWFTLSPHPNRIPAWGPRLSLLFIKMPKLIHWLLVSYVKMLGKDIRLIRG